MTCHDQLASLVALPAAVEWFRGLFRVAHLEASDTGELLTVLHHGDRAEVLSGHGSESPNFVIQVTGDAIARLAEAFADEKVDEDEEYRIVRFMLRPCLEGALRMPILNHSAIRSLLRMESVWQEALLDPDGNETTQLTAIRTDGLWRVLEGYHGTPGRRLVMRPDQVLEFQRRLFAANDENSLRGWIAMITWYVGWREDVTVRK